MPTSISSTSNYVGKVAGGIIGASFKEADTISRGLVTFAQNVNYILNMRKIAYTDGTQAYSCGFTPAGSVVLTERTLTPVKLKNDIQVCKETFRNTWSEDLIGSSAANPNSPSDIMTAIQAEVLAETAENTDNKIWNGVAATSDYWDGFVTLFGADAAIVKDGNGLTAPGAATTVSNIEAHLQLVVGAIPVKLRRKQLIFLISPDVADAYMQFLVSKGTANGLGGNANTQLVYGRYNLEVVNGLADDTFIVYAKDNLVFGTGLLGDHKEFGMVDEDSIGLFTGMVRGKMVYNGGCQYYNSEDIVWMVSTQ